MITDVTSTTTSPDTTANTTIQDTTSTNPTSTMQDTTSTEPYGDESTTNPDRGDGGDGEDQTSCQRRCGERAEPDNGRGPGERQRRVAKEPCSCDEECDFRNDCCPDYFEVCTDDEWSGSGDKPTYTTTEPAPTTTTVPPRIACTTYSVGDPHFRTCDGYYYNWQGACDYVFVKDCRAVGDGGTQFEIQTRNSNPGPRDTPRYPVTLTQGVAVRMPNGDVIELGRSNQADRNGVHLTFPTSPQTYGTAGSHPYTVQSYSYYYSYYSRKIITIPSLGVRITWDGWFNLIVDFSGTSPLLGSMCGLVGDGDGDRVNDVALVLDENHWQVEPNHRIFAQADPRDQPYCHTNSRRRHKRTTRMTRHNDLVLGLDAAKRSASAQHNTLERKLRTRRADPECSCNRDDEAAAFCSDLAPGGAYATLCPDAWDISYFDFCTCDFCYDVDAAIATIEAFQHACSVGNQSITDNPGGGGGGDSGGNISFPPLPTNGFMLQFGDTPSYCGDGGGGRAMDGDTLGNGSYTVGQCIAQATLEKAYVAVEYVDGDCVAHVSCATEWPCDGSCDAASLAGRTYIVPTWAPTPVPTLTPTSSPTASPTTSPTASPQEPTVGITVSGVTVTLSYSTGVQIWSTSLGDSVATVAHEGTVDDDGGYVYVVGETTGDFGLSSLGGSDGFIVRLRISDGSVMWVRQLGTGDLDVCTSVTIHVDGDVVVAGTTHDTLDGETSNGDSDAFIAKYNDNGDLQWVTQFGTSDADAGGFIDSDSSGKVVVYGYTLTDGVDDWQLLFTSFDSMGNVTSMKTYPLQNTV